MTRFGTVFAVAALGVALSGCDCDLFSREPAAGKTAQATCPPKPPCPPAAEPAAEPEQAAAETTTIRKVVRKSVRRKAARRDYAVREDYDAGLAGGRVYRRYSGSVTTEDYAYPRPPARYEERSGGRVYAYSRTESESESASVRSYEESSGSSYGYGEGYAEGSGYAYGYGGGFDPRRERHYAAGRDAQGYLVWPGKRD